MQPARFTWTLVAATCLGLASCGEREAEAGGTTRTGAADSMEETGTSARDALSGAYDSASKAVQDMDLSGLSPDALRERGRTILADLSNQLSGLQDSQAARGLVEKFQPALDQLAAAKSKLGGLSLDTTSVQSALDGLRSKLGSDSEVMRALQPLIDKVQALGR